MEENMRCERGMKGVFKEGESERIFSPVPWLLRTLPAIMQKDIKLECVSFLLWLDQKEGHNLFGFGLFFFLHSLSRSG